jgi:hypothetical protein
LNEIINDYSELNIQNDTNKILIIVISMDNIDVNISRANATVAQQIVRQGIL